MRFQIRVPADDVRSALRRARVSYATQQRDVLEALGVRVLSYAQQDYRTKSRGGRGSDGITWEPLAESTVNQKSKRGAAKRQKNRKQTKSGKLRAVQRSMAIGIDTGLQQASASPGFQASGGGNIFRLTNTEITVGYGRSYSEFFDEQRPLLPDVLPDAWRPELEGIVTRWAEKLMRGAFQ